MGWCGVGVVYGLHCLGVGHGAGEYASSCQPCGEGVAGSDGVVDAYALSVADCQAEAHAQDAFRVVHPDELGCMFGVLPRLLQPAGRGCVQALM